MVPRCSVPGLRRECPGVYSPDRGRAASHPVRVPEAPRAPGPLLAYRRHGGGRRGRHRLYLSVALPGYPIPPADGVRAGHRTRRLEQSGGADLFAAGNQRNPAIVPQLCPVCARAAGGRLPEVLLPHGARRHRRQGVFILAPGRTHHLLPFGPAQLFRPHLLGNQSLHELCGGALEIPGQGGGVQRRAGTGRKIPGNALPHDAPSSVGASLPPVPRRPGSLGPGSGVQAARTPAGL